MIITIDGPTASGKSTIARMLAQKLGYYYVNSGMLYRALAYLLVNKQGYTEHTLAFIDPKDIALCFDAQKFVYSYDVKHQEHIFFDKEDITPYLKDSFIDKVTSIASVNEYVRHCVTVLQHTLASDHDIVIDGRDVGSAVFPYADIKFYLTASIDVRAHRWLADQKKRGHHFTIQQAIEKITDRDTRDRERSIAPLIIGNDALVIDNSDVDLDTTFTIMLQHIQQKLSVTA